MAQTGTTGRRKSTRKTKRLLSSGQVHILATFNNTIVTITDTQGNAVTAASAGASGFKGSRKSTPYAARVAAELAVRNAQSLGMQEVAIFLKGPGPGRENAIRAVQASGMKVTSITAVTAAPNNGCVPPKKRRV